ncbi:MAG: metal ABC transporter ATP-binding protein, partial [Candidatus Ranarchaeia archaeon]
MKTTKAIESYPQTSEAQSPIICVRDIAVAYQENVAIFDVNLDVYAGEFYGICGPNGSGKTTLLKTLLGVLQPIRGQIHIFGKKLDKATQRNLLGKIGYVPQMHTVDRNFPALVEDVVMMGRYGQMGLLRWPNKRDKKAVEDALSAVQMERFATRPFGHLSTGQQQKILIARGLARNPEILFLDEPTASLDFKIARSILQLIQQLHRERDLTTIMVSH